MLAAGGAADGSSCKSSAQLLDSFLLSLQKVRPRGQNSVLPERDSGFLHPPISTHTHTHTQTVWGFWGEAAVYSLRCVQHETLVKVKISANMKVEMRSSPAGTSSRKRVSESVSQSYQGTPRGWSQHLVGGVSPTVKSQEGNF